MKFAEAEHLKETDERRAPQGARGLKYIQSVTCYHCTSRAPQGARGLKSAFLDLENLYYLVAPRKGRVG